MGHFTPIWQWDLAKCMKQNTIDLVPESFCSQKMFPFSSYMSIMRACMSFVRCERKLCHSLFFERHARSALAKFEWFCKTDHSSERGEREEDYSSLSRVAYMVTH